MDNPTSDNSIIREMFAHLRRNVRNPNTNQTQISIKDDILNLISHGDPNTSDLSLVKNALEEIFYYYSDTSAQHDLDIIFQNIEFLQILINFVYFSDRDIRLYSLYIVLCLIILDDNIYKVFTTEYDLFDHIKKILKEFDRDDESFLNCIGIVVKILVVIFHHKDQENKELFSEKNVPELFVELLSDIKSTKFSDIENQCIIVFFIKKSEDFNFNEEQFDQKFKHNMISPRRKHELIRKASFEESIIYIIGQMYNSWGNVNDYLTTTLQQKMLDILEADKIYLTFSISTCFNIMVNCNILEIININLIKHLNGIFDAVALQIFWKPVIELDISIFQCIYRCACKSGSQEEIDEYNKLSDTMLEIINAKLIYDLFNNIANTKNDKSIDYQQNSISLALKLFTIIFRFKRDVIIGNDTNSPDNKALNIDNFKQILAITEDLDSTYNLFKKKLTFIFTAIYTQDSIKNDNELISCLFKKYSINFIDLLETISNSKQTMILEVLIDLAEKSNQDENIQQFLLSKDLQKLLEEWRLNEDEEVGRKSQLLYEKIDELLVISQ